MRRTIASLTVMGLLAALSAPLAQAQVSSLSSSASAPGGTENVFFFRAYAEPTLWSTTLKIDGRNIATLKEKTFTALQLEPGPHRFKLAWPLLSAQSNADLQIEVEPGKIYYFAVIGAAGIDHVENNIIYVRDGSGFVPIEQERGASVVHSCCTFNAPAKPR